MLLLLQPLLLLLLVIVEFGPRKKQSFLTTQPHTVFSQHWILIHIIRINSCCSDTYYMHAEELSCHMTNGKKVFMLLRRVQKKMSSQNLGAFMSMRMTSNICEDKSNAIQIANEVFTFELLRMFTKSVQMRRIRVEIKTPSVEIFVQCAYESNTHAYLYIILYVLECGKRMLKHFVKVLFFLSLMLTKFSTCPNGMGL